MVRGECCVGVREMCRTGLNGKLYEDEEDVFYRGEEDVLYEGKKHVLYGRVRLDS